MEAEVSTYLEIIVHHGHGLETLFGANRLRSGRNKKLSEISFVSVSTPGAPKFCNQKRPDRIWKQNRRIRTKPSDFLSRLYKSGKILVLAHDQMIEPRPVFDDAAGIGPDAGNDCCLWKIVPETLQHRRCHDNIPHPVRATDKKAFWGFYSIIQSYSG